MIRALVPDDASDYQRIRREALEDSPFAFGSLPSDERARSIDFVREALASTDQAIFGAFEPSLVGVVGLYRDRGMKARSLAGVSQVHLAVNQRAPRAARLYQSLGFVTWSIEPAALRVAGEDLSEQHMVFSFGAA